MSAPKKELKSGKLKRKAQPSQSPEVSEKKKTLEMDVISPTSKIIVFKLDVIACNGQPIGHSTELGSQDLENIWSVTLGRSLEELSGYSSSKVKSKEIRIQYQLKSPMSIRTIANEQEFTHERSTVFATDLFKCRVVGLHEVRQANVGELVKVTVDKPNFDITPDQVIEWLSKFGTVKEGHRYPQLLVSKGTLR
jgi:hypothetical protein